MRLLLVSCRSPFLQDDRIYPPLGLLYLKAAVASEHPDVHVGQHERFFDTHLSGSR
jgi:hypothetical protein